jgi:hypothetical protein
VPTFRIKDPEEQKKARQELAEGALKEKLTLLNKLVVSSSIYTCEPCVGSYWGSQFLVGGACHVRWCTTLFVRARSTCLPSSESHKSAECGQKKARQELAEGALKEKLTLLNKLVVKS